MGTVEMKLAFAGEGDAVLPWPSDVGGCSTRDRLSSREDVCCFFRMIWKMKIYIEDFLEGSTGVYVCLCHVVLAVSMA